MAKPQAAVRDWQLLSESLRDYSKWLTPKGLMASDLDMVIHVGRGGEDHFLVGEFKAMGQRLPTGQRILLTALQKDQRFEVFTAFGPDKEGMYVLGLDWSGKVDIDGLASLVDTWHKAHKR